MKMKFLAGITLAFLVNYSVKAQTGAVQKQSKYNYTEAFAPFYNSNGNEYRSAGGQPGPKYWQNRADYEMRVRLDDRKNEIAGTVLLTYTNNSPDDLDFLWMQLEQNLFKQESRGSAIIPTTGSRNGAHGQEFDAGFKIRSIKLIAAQGAESTLNYEISDTRMQVFLPSTLKAAGGQVKLQIEYSFISPNYGSDRMGILETKNGKIYTVAQWYPRMCVYDDVLGWNTLPYLGPGEFYLEYGDFDVYITAPSSHIVAASGRLLNPEDVYTAEQQKRWAEASKSEQTVMIRSAKEINSLASRPSGKAELTWHYQIKNSRDFAWASSPAFIVDAARINLPSGKTALAISAYPEESSGINAWSRSTEYTKASIEFHSKKWYEYPYPTAVNVAGIPGGMEYPGVSFCGWKAKKDDLWGVTEHEFGHNWFPMIVGSNERLHAWMDEGFNTFLNTLSTDAFNMGEYREKRIDMHKWAATLTNPLFEPVMSSPANMKEISIAYLCYYKPQAGLTLLRDQILGTERFDRAFRAYIERWAYKHPTPDDFFRTIENVAGEDLSWFWRGWFQNNWRHDLAVEDVQYEKGNPKNGALITIRNMEMMPMPVILEIKTVSGKTDRVKLPVEIWKRNSSWTFRYPSTEELLSVTYDPDHVLPDHNPDNNEWKK